VIKEICSWLPPWLDEQEEILFIERLHLASFPIYCHFYRLHDCMWPSEVLHFTAATILPWTTVDYCCSNYRWRLGGTHCCNNVGLVSYFYYASHCLHSNNLSLRTRVVAAVSNSYIRNTEICMTRIYFNLHGSSFYGCFRFKMHFLKENVREVLQVQNNWKFVIKLFK